MPTYCYSKGRVTIERFFKLGEAPQEVTEKGAVYTRDYRAEFSGVRRRLEHDLVSEAMAVNPAEAKEKFREMKRMPGCPDSIDRNGCLHWTGVDAVSRRTAFERSRGLVNTKHFG
jgi:hypothetical protein